jgi:curved DNA-binding protein CbpA
VTAEPLPPFDLYGELEVSRRASAAVIEAVYRAIVQHQKAHAADSTDGERIKRLNTAHLWLTDPVRRGRYDAATSPRAAIGGDASPRSISRTTSRAAGDPSRATPRPESSESPSWSFGPNATEVRHFLADLRGLDWNRALQVFERRAIADADDYGNARRAVIASAQTNRLREWLFAREAASVIARGELGESAATDQVVELVVDAVGALVIRDLVPAAVLEPLLLPWTREGEAVPRRFDEPAIQAAAVSGAMDVAPSGTRPGRRRVPVSAWLTAAFAIVTLIAVGSVIAGLDEPKAGLPVAGATDRHSPAPARTLVADASLPAATTAATLGPASPSTVATDRPTSPPGNVAVAPTAGPAPTPGRTPVPAGTEVPVPTPAPTAAPTPTPPSMCTVPSLIDMPSSLAQRDWNAAGFSGTMVFSPVVPPHYQVKSQSLSIGSSVDCTSGITVTD